MRAKFLSMSLLSYWEGARRNSGENRLADDSANRRRQVTAEPRMPERTRARDQRAPRHPTFRLGIRSRLRRSTIRRPGS